MIKTNLKIDDQKNLKSDLAIKLNDIENKKQGFYSMFQEQEYKDTVEKIINYANSINGKFKNLIICGIGGSSLGFETIYETLNHKIKNNMQVFFLNNVDPITIEKVEKNIKIKESLFLIISKSGKTPETMAQYFFFKNLFEEEKIDPKDNFVIITDKKSYLEKVAIKNKFEIFFIPNKVGGRFSVLTAVGLLPSAILGIDIKKLITGGKKTSQNFLSKNPKENLAYQLAHKIFFKKKPQIVLMPYSSIMEKFTKWFSQLLAESTGKENKGLMPINAIGTTDQHSLLQIFTEGPKDKFIIFLTINECEKKIKLGNIPEEFDYLKNQNFYNLLNAAKQGTEQSLNELKIDNITITINEISEENIGELFLLFQGATAFLGEFLKINAFNQNGVERGKQIAKEILKKNS